MEYVFSKYSSMNDNEILYSQLDRQLYRIKDITNIVSVQDAINIDVQPESLAGGSIISDTSLISGELRSSNFRSGTSGWRLTPTSAELNVSTAINSLDIPDTTTANSFHVDSTGNLWLGANVATGYTGANAYVLKDGTAVFKSVSVGGTTLQYVITNSGIFSFGDGSDGDVTISSNTNLSADKYYNNLTVNNSATLNPSGYRIFVKGTLTLSGNGKIARNGNTGGSGGNGSAGAVGGASVAGAGGTCTALADGYLKGSLAGGSGGKGADQNDGNAVAGTAGANTTNSLGSNGSAGSTGGASHDGARAEAAGASGGTTTASNVRLIANWHLATLLDISSTGSTVKFDNSAPAGGGGGGGSALGDNKMGGGGGGAGGTAGGIVAVYAKTISIASGSSVTSNGGNGGAGGAGGNGITVNDDGGGGGGGGGGGNGGIVILVYNSLSNSGSITASAGSGGSGGAAGTGTAGNGNAGTAGVVGSAGTIYQFQLSL